MNSKNKKKTFLINEEIPFSQILLVSKDGKNTKIVSRLEALKEAENFGLNLQCVNSFTNPPVCKLVDYYQINKNKKTKKKLYQKQEITFSISIEEEHWKMKLERIKNWIDKGMTVKVSLVLYGREKAYREEEFVKKKCQEKVDDIKKISPNIFLKGDKIYQIPSGYYFFVCKSSSK